MNHTNEDNDVLRGEAARLSGLRAALTSSNSNTNMTTTLDVGLLQAALEPFLQPENSDDDENNSQSASMTTTTTKLPLHQGYVNLSWQTESEETLDCHGYLVLTRQSCLFCALTAASTVANDWYIPATSITLHALAEEGAAVYMQMENPEDESDPFEWTVTPTSIALNVVEDHNNDAQSTAAAATALYEALSKLVSLNPIDPHEETNFNDDDDDDDNFEPDDMIWASDIVADDDGDGDGDDGAATAEERAAMLERLDQVLIVPPEYEISDESNNVASAAATAAEGQFDDAEDEDKNNDNNEDDNIL